MAETAALEEKARDPDQAVPNAELAKLVPRVHLVMTEDDLRDCAYPIDGEAAAAAADAPSPPRSVDAATLQRLRNRYVLPGVLSWTFEAGFRHRTKESPLRYVACFPC